MLKKLILLSNSVWYWIGLIALSISLEVVALFYQYVWQELPCVLCIHVRIWVMGLFLLSLLALYLRRFYWPRLISHVLVFVIMLGLFERSWILLGTERGFVETSCDFKSGLPDWFALDQWFPLLFEVQASCGYTPNLLFGITMAEALIVMSLLLVLLSGLLIILTIIKRQK